MSDTKNDGPVVGDDNFVNVDPDFANWSNEVDRPLPMEEVEDYNLPEGFREEDKKGEKKTEDKKGEAPKASTTAPPAVAPPASK